MKTCKDCKFFEKNSGNCRVDSPVKTTIVVYDCHPNCNNGGLRSSFIDIANQITIDPERLACEKFKQLTP
jgi:hypothetical protein